MDKHLPSILITAGEPAGIGPDLCVMLAQQPVQAGIVVVADANLLAERARMLCLPLEIEIYSEGTPPSPHQGKGKLAVLHVDAATPVIPGKLDPANSPYVLNILTTAINGCLSHEFDAMVTAPVHKGIINDAGIPFTGHTEFLAEYTGISQVVMMLVGGGMRVALVTTHLPLHEVPKAINRETLESTIRILHADLAHRFGISSPCILVSGLNPHAGEGGHLGCEEIETIQPVLEKLRSEGMHLTGPLPADTMFSKKNLAMADCFLAMYHDQGLPVLKYASFGEGVNVTLGLPIIRTSVDHGTALDLAGKGNIDIGSLLAAIGLAADVARGNP